MRDNCIFCKIIKGESPSTKIFEDDNTLIIAPKEAESKGHMLAIPKRHYENIFDISERDLSYLMITLKKISNKLKDNWNVQGINLLHASGKEAGQSVSHFHIHLIPRFENDCIDAWPKFSFVDKERDKIYKEIKKALK